MLFLLLSVLGVRQLILDAMSDTMRMSIAVGIGLFIAFIGLKNGGVITDHPGTLVSLDRDKLMSADAAVFWTGLLTTAVLYVRRVRGSIIVGIATAAVIAIVFGCDWAWGWMQGRPWDCRCPQ